MLFGGALTHLISEWFSRQPPIDPAAAGSEAGLIAAVTKAAPYGFHGLLHVMPQAEGEVVSGEYILERERNLAHPLAWTTNVPESAPQSVGRWR
jgi:hypothetical protein